MFPELLVFFFFFCMGAAPFQNDTCKGRSRETAPIQSTENIQVIDSD